MRDIIFNTSNKDVMEKYIYMIRSRAVEIINKKKEYILSENNVQYDNPKDYHIVPLGYKNIKDNIGKMFGFIILPILIKYDIDNDRIISYNDICDLITKELDNIPIVIYDKDYNKVLELYDIDKFIDVFIKKYINYISYKYRHVYRNVLTEIEYIITKEN